MENVLPKGFLVGNENNDYTGVTVLLCPQGAAAGVDVRGGAPGTHETDLLSPEKAMEKIHAVALCGGSAYGLGAVAGVMENLKERHIGFAVGDKIVPIVCGAVIFDLNDKDYHYPDKQDGFSATQNASTSLQNGKVGAGKGATVGKALGMEHCCPSGIGIATLVVGASVVTCLIVVNAFGDVKEGGKIIAGAKGEKGFIDTEKLLLSCNQSEKTLGANTTIGCIMTDATLTKVQANKLSSIAHNGLARTVFPVHTDYDGDTLFCMSSCQNPPEDFLQMEVAVQKAVEYAVLDAVKSCLQ